MASKFVHEKGGYAKTVEDSSHQASNKFTKSLNKPTDNLPKPSQRANKPVRSGKGKAGAEQAEHSASNP